MVNILWRKLSKSIIYLSAFVLVFNASFLSAFLVAPVNVAQAAEGEDLCQVPVDVVLLMDVSGSMLDGAAPTLCQWEQLEFNGVSYQWVLHIDEGLTEAECADAEHNHPPLHPSLFTPAKSSKIDSAKAAANSFVDNLGIGDQSGVVSFSNTATLNKELNSDHPATQTAINSLSPVGATNIGDAIGAGTIELDTNGNDEAVKVMILLTDGKANKPYGLGYGESPQDVAYAEAQAELAAFLGYKIFTIGLGGNGDINETMLQNIANSTGATYHHALDGDDLSGIYDTISQQVCEYGSISGCKYNDIDNSGTIDLGEPTLTGWTINLNNSIATTTQTIIDGCYTFAGLEDGVYTITEEPQVGWLQTYPAAGSYTIAISDHNNVEGVDFANYELPQAECGNSILEEGELCELGDTNSCSTLDGYDGTQLCNQTCDGFEELCSTTQSCGDGAINGLEECDGELGVDEHQICTESCTLEDLTYCGDGILQQPNSEGTGGPLNDGVEDCDGIDGVGEGQQCSSECVLEFIPQGTYCGDGYVQTPNDQGSGGPLNDGVEECDGDDGVTPGVNTCTNECILEDLPPAPVCGDGEVNQESEECDDGNLDNGDGCSDQCLEEIPEPPVPVCGDGEVNQGSEQCDDGNLDSGDGCDSQCLLEPQGIQAGDIVINEIMQDPFLVSDLKGEWFELYNTTDTELDLEGCAIGDLGANYHIIGSSLPIAPHGFVVLGIEDDQSLNGGVPVDYQFSSFGLSNEDDEVLLSCNNTEIDRVVYDGGPSFPDPEIGASIILASPALDNNLGSNWCQSTSLYGLGDLGTPGAQNDLCPGFYGSISIYKYEDLDGDLLTTQDQELASTTPWTFNLANGASSLSTTTADGLATLSNLVVGDYTITEEPQAGWFNLGSDPSGEPFSLVDGANSISFFNTQYSSISGYKFEDEDNNLETTGDQTPGEGWTIHLYDSPEATEPLSSTLTNSSGFFEFVDLVPGEYYLDEDLPTSWIQLSSPAGPLVLLSGTHLVDNNFINYFAGGSGGQEPEPEPSGGGGGGGGFTARPEVEISSTYPPDKWLDAESVETLVVSNQGNIILTNGVLTVDLPEDKLSFVSAVPAWQNLDETTQLASWDISTLSVDEALTFIFSVQPLDPGEAQTLVNVTFDQASADDILVETILISGVGGPPAAGGEAGGASPSAGGEASQTGPPAGGTIEGGAVVAGEATATSETPGEVVTAGEEEETGEEEEVMVEPIQKECEATPWWVWLVVVILHLWTVGAYSFLVKSSKPAEDSAQLPLDDKKKNNQPQTGYPWLWWSLVALSLVIIYLLFALVASFPVVVTLLVLVSYLAVVASHYFVVVKNHKNLWPFVPLVLAVGPIAVYLFTGSWTWWLWLLILGFYALTIYFYYRSLDKDIASDNWWLTTLFLTLLALILELAISLALACYIT